jgi:hypothetical protein
MQFSSSIIFPSGSERQTGPLEIREAAVHLAFWAFDRMRIQGKGMT